MKIKAKFVFILGMACSYFALADGILQKEPNDFNGFYVGGALGPSFINSHQTIDGLVDANFADTGLGALDLLTPLGFQTDAVKNALMGTIFAGYGRTWQRFYLGGEIAVTGSDYKMVNHFEAGLNLAVAGLPLNLANAMITTTTKVSQAQFTASLRPGYLITPKALLYGRVGVAVAKLTYNAVSNATLFGINNVITPSASKQGGFLLIGGGLEHSINEHVTFRVDYNYTDYGRIRANLSQTSLTNFSLLGSNAPVNFTVTGNNYAHVYDQNVMFGLTYQFAG